MLISNGAIIIESDLMTLLIFSKSQISLISDLNLMMLLLFHIYQISHGMCINQKDSKIVIGAIFSASTNNKK